MEEAELIARLRAQDEAALTELVVSYGGFINQVIRACGQNPGLRV